MAVTLDPASGGYQYAADQPDPIPLVGSSADGKLPLAAVKPPPPDPALSDAPPPDYYQPHGELVGPVVGPLVGQLVDTWI